MLLCDNKMIDTWVNLRKVSLNNKMSKNVLINIKYSTQAQERGKTSGYDNTEHM